MSKIISIGTAVPPYAHAQDDILPFFQRIHAMGEAEKRKLRFLSHHSGINTRYSVIPDYSLPIREWKFYPPTENLEPFPLMQQRMQWYRNHAAPLSLKAIRYCLHQKITAGRITHLITVSCTGMSAPGLDLEIAELLDLPRTVFRTSVNFMGCYAAIHALKLADSFCAARADARVLIVCTELCTLHFQREGTPDNILSSLLFADGSAAALVVHDDHPGKGIHIEGFYSEIIPKGKKDMAWELTDTGFQMTLSSYIPELIENDFPSLVNLALADTGFRGSDITHWCIHPGGKKILDTIAATMRLPDNALAASYETLADFGNMSSATLLFVLEKLMSKIDFRHTNTLFGAAFGPGLTMETFTATTRI